MVIWVRTYSSRKENITEREKEKATEVERKNEGRKRRESMERRSSSSHLSFCHPSLLHKVRKGDRDT